MNRRDLTKYLLATPLAATFDYERLLWVPGQMVTVPGVGPSVEFARGDVFEVSIYANSLNPKHYYVTVPQNIASVSLYIDGQAFDYAPPYSFS